MTFRCIQKLQHFDFSFVHRVDNQHGNADDLSKCTSELPNEATGEREGLTGSFHEPVSLEVSLERTRERRGQWRRLGVAHWMVKQCSGEERGLM